MCFLTAISARSVTQTTPELLEMAARILNPKPGDALVLADAEHFSAEPLDQVHCKKGFDLRVPIPDYRSRQD